MPGARPPGTAGLAGAGRTGRALLLVLALVAAAQLVLLARRATALDEQARRVESWLHGPWQGDDPAMAQVLAWRALPELAALVPETSRVLVVNGSPFPAQFHFFFLPRPFASLQRLDETHLRKARELLPHLAPLLEVQFGLIEAAGLRLTPERLDEELARAGHVVLFQVDETLRAEVLARARAAGRALEPVRRVESATLLRVREG